VKKNLTSMLALLLITSWPVSSSAGLILSAQSVIQNTLGTFGTLPPNSIRLCV
jgi:hypothetical protein